MTPTTENPAGDGRAFECLAGWLDTPEYTRSPHDPQALAGLRQESQIERLHRLGPRCLAEMIVEIATATGQPALIADRLQAYAGLDPELVRYIGGDNFPPMPLQVMP